MCVRNLSALLYPLPVFSIVSVHRSDVEPDVVMEGGRLAAGDFSQNLKRSNQELEEECVKLQDVVDKMVTFAERAILKCVCICIQSQLFRQRQTYC